MKAIFFSSVKPLRAALLLALGTTAGCTTTTSSDPQSAASPESTEETAVPVKEEVPNVQKCHTETTTCDLAEPLQPGLGCFCTGADGAQEAGTAGG